MGQDVGIGGGMSHRMGIRMWMRMRMGFGVGDGDDAVDVACCDINCAA